MKKLKAGTTVDEGIYLDLRRFAFKSLEEAGPLPGTEGTTYVRVPILLVLPLGLVLSLAFVIFLPLAGFVMLAALILEKLFDLGNRGLRTAMRVVHGALHRPAHAARH